MKRELKRYKVDDGIYYPLLACDIENDPKTGAFVCAGVYGEIKRRKSVRDGDNVTTETSYEIIEHYSTNIEEFQSFIMSLKKGSCLLIFYNLPYDKVYFDGIIAPPKLGRSGKITSSVLTVGTRVITMELKNGIKCMDLFNHTCEGSLEDWGKYTDCPVKKSSLKDLQKRVITDAKITFHVGKFIQDFYYKQCHIPIQLTVGASALKLFTKEFFTDYWYRDNEFFSTFERQAYYGGRTELFKKGEYYNYSYDINSTYLSIMRDKEFPDMSTGFYVKDGYNWRENYDKYMGIFHVRVHVPDNTKIPILPVRLGGKLKFPVGEFDGFWCNVELKEAEKRGVKILKCYDFLCYRKSKKYFSDFANFVWKKRFEYQKAQNKGMDKMIKRIGNSLYGKFAQRNTTEIFCRLSEYPSLIPDGSELLEYKGDQWIIAKGETLPAKFEFPAIAAFITAYARIKLFEGMEANQDTLIYADTDSIKLTAPAKGIDIGNDLGQWKNEGEKTCLFYRPKFYGDKHKGVPTVCNYKISGKCTATDIKNCVKPHNYGVGYCNCAEVIEKTEDYIKYRFTKPTREREAIRRNLIANQWIEVEKILTFVDDKRIWNNTESKPIKYIDNLN